MNATTYKNGINEGGEGYNPFVKTETTYNRTLHQCRIMDKMNSMPVGCPEYVELKNELDAMKAEDEAAFAAEWTPETTTTRRQLWNTWAKAQTKMNGYIVAQKEKEFGFSLDSLKKAVALNKL